MEHMDEMGYEEQVREETIRKAMERFGALIREDFKRIDGMKQAPGRKDFKKLDHITVGILPGDGIGPYIMEQAPAGGKIPAAGRSGFREGGIPDHPRHDHRGTGPKERKPAGGSAGSLQGL